MSKSAFIAFIAGAAIGSVAAWQFAKKKYEQIAQEEIDSVKEYYAKKYDRPIPEDTSVPEEQPHIENDKPDIMEFASRLRKQGYTGYDGYSKELKENPTITTPGERPYVISPDEFGEFEDYSKISLTYYADEVLCDDMDVPVDNIDEIVGADFADHFGEYEDDSVFVRNDARRCDYEILRSLRLYSEVIAENPYKAEV